jgi:hypothetical protein
MVVEEVTVVHQVVVVDTKRVDGVVTTQAQVQQVVMDAQGETV